MSLCIRGISLKNVEKFINGWEKNREKGKKKYILINGVSMGMAALIGSIIGRIIKGNIIYSYWYHIVFFLVSFIGNILICINSWNNNEKKYKELINNK